MQELLTEKSYLIDFSFK